MIDQHHSRPARVARLLPVLAVSVLLSACASTRAYPPPSGDVNAELTAWGPYLQPSALTAYDSRHEGDRGGLTPRAWRDVVVNARVRAIDLQFTAFQQRRRQPIVRNRATSIEYVNFTQSWPSWMASSRT